MGELYFKAELLDDVVLSQRTATAGDHKSLDYIPGSVFLGIASSKFYATLGKEDAWNLFHTSKIHFCNAYPVANGQRTFPMPLSFHSEKVPRQGKEHCVLNFVYAETKEAEIQYRQNRNGYVGFSDDGVLPVLVPSKTSRMRTAIDAGTGTAAKSQLYGYESLNAGQFFIGKIEWEDSIKDIAAPIINLFGSDTVVHAGRSKTASYGRVRLSKTDCAGNTPDAEALSGSSFSILAVSDLCLRNPVTGAPEQQLSPVFLGLENGWQVDRARSFSRPSYLYQYNAHRKEIELQKTLISKGSVFTFTSEKGLSGEEKEKVLSAIRRGIGTAKGQGFGEIALFNSRKEFQATEAQKIAPAENLSPSERENQWLAWLKPVFLNANVVEKVSTAVSEFVRLCKCIKEFNTFDAETVFWPGNAQWGRVLEAARNCTSKKDLRIKLFEGDNPVIKTKKETQTERNGDTKLFVPDQEWNYEASFRAGSQKLETLRNWLMDFVNDNSLNDKDTKIALQELIRRCKDKIADKDWLKEGAK